MQASENQINYADTRMMGTFGWAPTSPDSRKIMRFFLCFCHVACFLYVSTKFTMSKYWFWYQSPNILHLSMGLFLLHRLEECISTILADNWSMINSIG
jgi:hypothetical protein